MKKLLRKQLILICFFAITIGFLPFVVKATGANINFGELATVPTIEGYEFADISTSGDIYYIQNNYSNKYIDIHGPSTSEGALIHEWTYHPNLSENWEITLDNDTGYYTIKSIYSNMYIGIDITDLGLDKDNIKQYPTAGDYCQWIIYIDDDDNYLIRLVNYSSEFLSAPTSSPYNELQLSDDAGSSIEWKLHKQVNISNGTYFIQNMDTRRYADLCGPSTADGAIIHQWDLNASNLTNISSWRQWEFTKQSDLYYTIKNVYSNKYLGLDTSTLAIKQYSSIADNTKWKIYPISTFTIPNNNGDPQTVTEYIFVPKGYSYPPYSYSFGVEAGTDVNGRELVLKSVSDDTRISWDLAKASLTYEGRITTWGYQDSMYNYYFGYFEPQDTIGGIGYRHFDVYEEHQQPDYTNFTDLLENSIDYAESEWVRASGSNYPYYSYYHYIHNFYEEDEEDADLLIYGGDSEYLGWDGVNDPAGSTSCPGGYTTQGFVIYYNEILDIRRYNVTKIKVRNYASGRTEYNMDLVVTHEMGHAFGYAGHSYNNVLAVLNGSYSTNRLQSNEIIFIMQIWEIYYE
ncbi:RICIN domain-containing protein [Mycoplasmatota bacterium WC30]